MCGNGGRGGGGEAAAHMQRGRGGGEACQLHTYAGRRTASLPPFPAAAQWWSPRTGFDTLVIPRNRKVRPRSLVDGGKNILKFILMSKELRIFYPLLLQGTVGLRRIPFLVSPFLPLPLPRRGRGGVRTVSLFLPRSDPPPPPSVGPSPSSCQLRSGARCNTSDDCPESDRHNCVVVRKS